MKKIFALAIMALLAASSLVLVGSVFAQAPPKPSIPEFALTYHDHSYDVSATYGTDPYTGQTVVTQAEYHVQNKTIELKIKDPSFQTYTDADGNNIRLYYTIRARGHFDGSWFYLDSGYYGLDAHYVGADPDSDYTTLLYGIVGNNGSSGQHCLDISSGGSIDFQIQAFVGYNTKISEGMTMFGEVYHYVFTGETSDWSFIHTLSISDNSVSTSSSPNPMSPTPSTTSSTTTRSPTVTSTTDLPADSQFIWLLFGVVVGLGALVALLVVVVGFMRRRISVLERKQNGT